MNKILSKITQNKKTLLNLLTLLLFVIMGVYLYRNREVFQSLKNIELSQILVISITSIFMVLLNALLNIIVIGNFNKKISIKEYLPLQYANNFLNKIVTKGGAIFRGYYLKEIHNLTYSKFASTLAGTYIITFLSYGVVGSITLLLIYLQSSIFNTVMSLFFIGLTGSTLFLILTKRTFKFKSDSKIGKLLIKILDGWKKIKQNPKGLIYLFIVTLIMLIISAIQTAVIYTALGENIGIIEATFMSTINVITVFLNITPDGIGVKEGVFMFSSQLINIDPDIILLGSLIGRCVDLTISMILGGPSYLFLISKINQKNID